MWYVEMIIKYFWFIKIYRKVEEMINSKNLDCLYVASSPKVNISNKLINLS